MAAAGSVPFALCLALMVVPYLLLTYHVTIKLPQSKPVASGDAAPIDLAGYYATIESAQRLLDSLNTSSSSSATRTAPKGVRDLVVGLAKGIPTTNLAVFATSLRRNAPQHVDVALFVDRDSVDAELGELATAQRVDLKIYDVERLEPPHLRNFHPSSFRWPIISRYLETLEGAGYRGVLMADVRDTAFQADPFEPILGGASSSGAFYAFHGVESRTIGQCGWNGGWIRDCFGEPKLRSLATKPILCSGVSIAHFDAALAYAKQMSAVVSNPDFVNCERNGVDQGVHNVLLHERRVRGAKIVPQRGALVANLQARVAVISGTRVLKASDDAPVAVVHQYDRFPNLAKHYFETYGTSDNKADACSAFEVTPNVDLFKGKCDLGVASGTAEKDCCKSCNNDSRCKGWTLAGSLCYLKSCDRPAVEKQFRGDRVEATIIEFVAGFGFVAWDKPRPRDVPDDAVVLVVYVEKVDWPIDLGNPFVSAFIQPQLDDELKHQAQKSSVKPHARNPWWIPAERFEFIVAELDASRLVVEVSDHRGSRPGVTVAEGSVRLKKVAAAVEQTHRLKLFRTDNGQRENNGVLQVRLRIAPKEHYFNLVEDLVFEYARLEGPCRIDVAERDPGRFSDETGVLFFDRFRDAAPKMPPGFEIERPWEVESTPKNANGWQFARSFDSGWWYDEQFYGARACRRRWTRECRRAGQS
ncbi:hypothetical protein CTAYLR_003638, partial [Chrysophaeum taylorii]